MSVPATEPRVAVILVNYGDPADTIACIGSLRAMGHEGLSIVVVDNGPGDDGAAEAIAEADPAVRLLRPGRNLGFAGGNNLGIAAAMEVGADYLWLLNNDTIVRPEALVHLLRMAEEHPGYPFYGSWIVYYSDPDRLWFGGGGYNRYTGWTWSRSFGERPDRAEGRGRAVPTDWITGCSLLVRAEAAGAIGPLDEDFFLYREELEWQLRWRGRPAAMILGEPLVLHKVGAATGSTRGELGTVFMSRNFLKLMARRTYLFAPAWLATWLFQYVAIPMVKRDRRALAAAFRSVRLLRTPGAEVARLLAGPRTGASA